KCLKATAPPTTTRLAVVLIYRVVSKYTCKAVVTTVRPAAQEHAAPQATADCHPDKVLNASSGAPRCLSQSRHVCVHGRIDRQPESRPSDFTQRHVEPAKVARNGHAPSHQVNQTG